MINHSQNERRILGIAVLAVIFAMVAYNTASQISGGGGVSFDGSVVNLNGSRLDNGTFYGTFNKTVNKLIFKHDFIGNQEWVNITNLSINNDSYYDIYAMANISSASAPTSLKMFINGDFVENNYRRQYVYASGATLFSALDFSTDISAMSTSMSSNSKIHIEKSHSGKVRMIIEGNLDEGLSFFNMQMYNIQTFNDVNNISFRLVPSGVSGVKVHVFALR